MTNIKYVMLFFTTIKYLSEERDIGTEIHALNENGGGGGGLYLESIVFEIMFLNKL